MHPLSREDKLLAYLSSCGDQEPDTSSEYFAEDRDDDRIELIRRQIQEILDKGHNKSAVDLLNLRELKKTLKQANEDAADENCLRNIETDGRTFAGGYAILTLTPWSNSFAHGSDTLVPITELVSKVLQPGEKLSTLDRVTWHKPIRTDIMIRASTSPLPEGEYVCDGEFSTDQGRKIFFGCNTTEHNIRYEMPNNQYANNAVRSIYEENDGSFTITLYPTWEIYKAQLNENPSITISTILEIMTIALDIASKQNKTKDISRASCSLVGGFRNVQMPPDIWERLSKNPKLHLKIDKKPQEGRSGFSLYRFECQFADLTQKGSGILAITYSQETANRNVLR